MKQTRLPGWKAVLLGLLILPESLMAFRPSSAEMNAFQYQAGYPKTEPAGMDFGSPAVIDINRDQKMEVLAADGGGCVWGWDSRGQALPGFPLKPWGSCSSGNRISGPVAIGDVDGDAALEIVVGTKGSGQQAGARGKVFVWNPDGSLLPGWPKEMDWNLQYGNGHAEVYSVALGNVSGDGRLEVIAGTSNNSSAGGTTEDDTRNLYVWNGDGTILPGFPTWYRRAGIYGMVGAANLVGDAHDEVIAVRDSRWVVAYNGSGETMPGWPVETWISPDGSSGEPYLTFTRNAASMADLDGDGKVEVVLSGPVKTAVSDALNSGVMVVEADGQRAPGWETAKLGDRPPLVEDYGPSQAAALADIDRDGKLEIVVALGDGTLRAYRYNGDLMWKYDYAQGRPLFASEAAVGDISGDGRVDIVFGTYSPDGRAQDAVRLLALDAGGHLLPGFPLPLTHETNSEKKGIRSAPTLADIDGDCDVEIVAGSWGGTVYAWDLRASYRADLLPWPTGRQNYQRTGAYEEATQNSVQPLSQASQARANVFLPMVGQRTACAGH
jgi:hypothetical protein